jgi:hypothetical protein
LPYVLIYDTNKEEYTKKTTYYRIMHNIFSKKYTTILCTSLVLVGISLFLPKHPLSIYFGLAVIGYYLLLHAYTLSLTRFFTALPYPVFFTGLSIITFFTTIQSIVYFFYQIHTGTILAILSSISIGTILLHKKGVTPPSLKDIRRTFSLNALSLIILLLQGVLVWTIFSRSTTGVLQTPWLIFGKHFFITYATALFLLLVYIWKSKKKHTGILLTILHFFITYNIITLIYPLGFGYDPFLHRATEQHILHHGFASPKTPFYLGQYSLIIMFAKITHLSVHVIDIWLVPLLSSILLPATTYISMRHGFNLSSRWANIGTLLMLVFPLTTMVITTPQNLANLFLLLTILTTSLCKTYHRAYIPATLLAITSAMIHPISGVFACLLVLSVYIIQQDLRHKKNVLLVLFFTSAISIPALFFMYFVLQHMPIPSLSTIFGQISSFTTLFDRPYYFKKDIPASYILEYTYGYQKIIPALLIGFSLYYVKTCRSITHYVYLFFPLAILVNMFFMSTWLIFPNLYHFEQGHYAQRLAHISLYFLIPFFIAGTLLLLKKYKKTKKTPYGAFLILAICITTSWYLTYPQKNAKMAYPGFNVTSADIHATEFIDTQEGGNTSYIVLSSNITAASAIHQYGFKTYHHTNKRPYFYYAIPSGGDLAITFRKLLYEGQKKSDIDAILTKTGVVRAYVVLNSYWYDSVAINKGLRVIADGEKIIDNGAIMVYWFDQKEE